VKHVRRFKTASLLVFICLLTNLFVALVPSLTSVAEDGSRAGTPDVIVTDIEVSPEMLFVGDNITITATIANVGTDNATNVSVAFEAGNETLPALIDLGNDTTIGADNGGQNLTNITPMQVSIHWNTSEAGFEVQAGYIYTINVTATNLTNDANITNDTMSIEISFLNMSYLVVSELTPSATEVMVGAPFNITYAVENIGSQDQPPPGDTLYLYVDNGTEGVESIAVRDLEAKGSVQGVFDLDTSGMTIGNHTFKLELFFAKTNMTSENITFTYPDLYIGEVNWTPYNGTVGDNITVNATVHNNGTANATAVLVHFYVDAPYLHEAYNDTINVTIGGTNVSTFEWNTTGLKAGNHTVKADLDPEWMSSNVTGNITLEPGGMADLAVIECSLSPAEVDIGDIVNISATIKNVGDWPSEATTVGFRSVKGLNSTPLGEVAIPELQPGQSIKIYYLWDTAGLEVWNYVVWVQADPEGLVDELNLANNKCEAPLILKGKPDLAVISMNMTIGREEIVNISQGKSATVNANVSNIGTKKSVNTTVTLYLDDGAVPIVTKNIFGLGVGGEYQIQFDIDTSSFSVGNHTLKVWADADEANEEIDEANNIGLMNITVLEPPGVVDLKVTAVSVTPSQPRVGDPVYITATIVNNGTADVVNATLRFSYLTPGGGTDIEVEVIPSLKVGEEVNKTVSWGTGPLTHGDFTINVSIDPMNELRDLDRTNNFKHASVTLDPRVACNQVFLIITDIILDPEKPVKDEKVTITVKITNIGDCVANDLRVVFLVDELEIGTTTGLTILANNGTGTAVATWNARDGMHEIKAEVYVGTSAEPDDGYSKVVNIKSTGPQIEDFTIIILVIIIVLIIAILLLVMRPKGDAGKPAKGFIEDEHDEDDELDVEEEEESGEEE
jgi:subtilase family serine protease